MPELEARSETPRRCDSAGCDQPGDYRAPRSRCNLRDFYWFCVDHVRAYNKSWNYFAGMNEEEMEAVWRSDTTWERPTWPMGCQELHVAGDDPEAQLRAALRVFAYNRAQRAAARGIPSRLGEVQRRALGVFDLEAPLTLDRVKARYKELVKRHHPDANGGDRLAEEKIKQVNDAYRTLTDFVSPARAS